jgi:hypothetical protein
MCHPQGSRGFIFLSPAQAPFIDSATTTTLSVPFVDSGYSEALQRLSIGVGFGHKNWART